MITGLGKYLLTPLRLSRWGRQRSTGRQEPWRLGHRRRLQAPWGYGLVTAEVDWSEGGALERIWATGANL